MRQRINVISILIALLTKVLYISGNGYIEGSELDGFLKEFISTVDSDGSVKSTVSHHSNISKIFDYLKKILETCQNVKSPYLPIKATVYQ